MPKLHGSDRLLDNALQIARRILKDLSKELSALGDDGESLAWLILDLDEDLREGGTVPSRWASAKRPVEGDQK